ncbi:hypothetical protein T190611E02C_50116 [Tenacibaculum sp. 190524A05c]
MSLISLLKLFSFTGLDVKIKKCLVKFIASSMDLALIRRSFLLSKTIRGFKYLDNSWLSKISKMIEFFIFSNESNFFEDTPISSI